ncbi:transporter [Bifidobacterium callitrichos DSM 23973]|uniref:Transporter n=1 Tax=Bifidobacterium callitrichos DSM 23973 TaxID=1437609 RepID=A0A087A7C6_9BIFI|nr:flippase [Bifidobacterium callitrichos]KFI54676.1 transporter [Bifidobacterium callitrichos DSM 23973]
MKKEKSLKKNFLMNIILTGSQFIFPLITFPYVSRILLADGNGKINFASSIVSYFVLIASLGIPLYGIRATAVVRDDKIKLSKIVHELFFINLFTCFVSSILLILLIIFIPKFHVYASLLLIFSVTIWLNLIGIDWLYQGLEEYSYITKRSILFKFIGIFLMFLFVHEHSDYIKYAIITVIGSSGSLLLNFFKSRKYVSLSLIRPYNFRQHVKPIINFFLLSASWTLYTNIDTAMLGFMTSDSEVGYYTAAIKVKTMLMSVISALGTVLLPRLSNYIATGKNNEFYRLLKKDFSFIVISSFSMLVFCVLNAEPIILLLSGSAFLPAVPVMQTVMMSIIFIGISTMLGNNVLIPRGKEIVTTISTFVSLFIIVILNIVLIPNFGAIGSAWATVVGEIIIVLIESFYLRHSIIKVIEIRTLLCVLLSSIISGTILFCSKLYLSSFSNNSFVILVITSCIFFVVLCFYFNNNT